MNTRIKISAIVLALSMFMLANAQVQPKKVYDETLNPLEQLDGALLKAKNEGKFVMVQLGGNWCPWCLLLADYVANDSVVNKKMNENYVYIHVNYHPRKSKIANPELTNSMLKRVGNPVRFGFPVLIVLDEQGAVVHIQDTALLEEGKGYNQKKVLDFLNNWTPQAVIKAKKGE